MRKQAETYRARGDEESAAKLDKLAVGLDMLKGGLTPSDSALGTIANTAAPLASYGIGQYAKAHGSEGSPAHIAAHATLAGLTAAANSGSGTDIATSAGTAAAAEFAAPYLAKQLYGTSDSSKLTAEQKETISNILGLAAAGTGAAVGNSATAYGASRAVENAVEDNWLTTKQLIEADKAYYECGDDDICKTRVIDAAKIFSQAQDSRLSWAKFSCFFGSCDNLDKYIGYKVQSADLNKAVQELKRHYPHAAESELKEAAKYYSAEAVDSFEKGTTRFIVGVLDTTPAAGLAGSATKSAIKGTAKIASKSFLRNTAKAGASKLTTQETAIPSLLSNQIPKTTNETADAVSAAELRAVLKTTEDANPLVESLRNTGKLPNNYITKAQARANGWLPKKSLNHTNPGKQLGGDIFQDPASIGLPVKNGRTWYEADVGLSNVVSRSNQPGTRLLYSDDGLLYITTKHYSDIHYIGRWKP